MKFVYEERPSASPFVEAVWRTEDSADGMYLAAADGAWDLLFTTEGDQTRVLVRGPASRATAVAYKKGNRNLGIRFKPGSFLPPLPAGSMLNAIHELPKRSTRSFWFLGENWELPTFDTADDYLAKLAHKNLLAKDAIVTAVLGGFRPAVSDRSIQRHFLHATGLSSRSMRNINRANRAVTLLQQGKAVLEVVCELGYADQAHLTRHVKQASGCTPGEIIKKMEVCRLRSIQGYGPCAEMRVQNYKRSNDEN